ncbi:PQQ-binding-like beta-propeller repeat protein [Kitasatospora sp. NPDC004669]|uniref:outer membrane protein assembly factor BamB family protein n=1 Tax=Kitasatospora sp. NPDC004669 TaxID=3154555 RepID=UPI0033BE0B4B
MVGPSATDLVKRRLSGLKLTDGSTAWTGDKDLFQVSVQPAGPNRVLVEGSDYGSAKGLTWFTDGTTGKLLLDINSPLHLICTYDERSVTVCAGEDSAFALDPATGKVLWKLPDDAKTRVAPRVTAVWHGVVYGRTSNGPVSLDATTGQDRPGNPQLAPVLVDGYAGLADTNGGIAAYAATG